MLKRLLPSCLGGTKAKIKQEKKYMSRKKTSQLYDSPIGKILMHWSHLLTGLFLSMDIPLSPPSSSSSIYEEEARFFSFKIYPGEKHGLRRLRTEQGIMHIAWDFRNAEFCTSNDAQPESAYFLCITINGQMILVLGDMKEEAYALLKARKPSYRNTASMISREDSVDMKDRHKYRTKVPLGDNKGSEASVSISHGNDVALKIHVGKKKVIDVKSIWNEIRGSKKLISEKETIEISWSRLDWVPARSKKKKEMATQREMTGVPLPAVVVDFISIRKDEAPKHFSFAVKLI